MNEQRKEKKKPMTSQGDRSFQTEKKKGLPLREIHYAFPQLKLNRRQHNQGIYEWRASEFRKLKLQNLAQKSEIKQYKKRSISYHQQQIMEIFEQPGRPSTTIAYSPGIAQKIIIRQTSNNQVQGKNEENNFTIKYIGLHNDQMGILSRKVPFQVRKNCNDKKIQIAEDIDIPDPMKYNQYLVNNYVIPRRLRVVHKQNSKSEDLSS